MAEEFSNSAKEAFRQFVHNVSHAGLHSLRLQYNELRSFAPNNFAHSASDANPLKCRYKDIVCLDSSRVVLRWPPGMSDDFIHANWVTHDLFENKFICSQAPLDSTVSEFWRVCWQEGVRQILMLCRCEEMGKTKCAQYWPVEVNEVKSLSFGMTIMCQKVDKSDKNFVHTRLLLRYDQEERKIDHRQWTTWPDKSVPQTPLAPFRLLHFTRKYNKQPSLIHCSAGVGRTGTMVAIEMIYKSLSNAIQPEPIKLVQNLRSQRFLAVQTEDQYVYCHYAIIQLAYAKKMAAKHDVKFFCKEYNSYAKMVLDSGGRPPPLNATKLPGECLRCKKIPEGRMPKAPITETEGVKVDVDVEPQPSNCTVSPLQTKVSPASLSPIHRVQSMPNWSCIDGTGASDFAQQHEKKFDQKGQGLNPTHLANDNLSDAIPPTEAVYNDQYMKNKTEPIRPISSVPLPPQSNVPDVQHRASSPSYTVQSAKGVNESRKIIYHRNPDKPYVKAIAGPHGAPSMQISVPKHQLEEFHRQVRLKAEEIERKKKKREAEQQAGPGNPPPPPPPKKDSESK